MNLASADALSARHRLQTGGWVARSAESFRHLPPPPAEVWLGDVAPAGGCEAAPSEGAGWTLQPLGSPGPLGTQAPARFEARWLDASDPRQRAELLAGLPLPGDEDAAPFGWAHRALCRSGLRLRVAAGSGALRLQLRHQPRAEVEAPLLVLELEPGAQLELIELHEREAGGACRRALVQNLQLHLQLGAGATLQHLRVVTPDAQDRVAHHLQARLAQGARYRQALLASGSAYQLQRNAIALDGERAEAHCGALLLADSVSLEQQIAVRHGAPHTHSAVRVLALGRGKARVVVNAHTRIDPGADGAQAHQNLRGVPAAGPPRLVLRPHLEILHDQVQAAHGASCGALPEEALFYAAQRGIDETAARALILRGMAEAVLGAALEREELSTLPGLDERLTRSLAQHLGGGRDA